MIVITTIFFIENNDILTGDMATKPLGFGYLASVILCAILILIPAIAYFKFKVGLKQTES